MTKSSYNKLAKNTTYLYIRMIVVMLITLYTSRVIFRTLGVEDFGIFNVVGGVVFFLAFFQEALRNACSRYLTYAIGVDDYIQINNVFSMSINTHILLSIFLVIILEIGGLWIIKNELNINPDRIDEAIWVFHFSILTMVFTILRTPFDSAILAFERMDFYALTSIVEVLLKLFIVWLLSVFAYEKLIVYAVLLSFVSLVLLIWYALYCYAKFKPVKFRFIWDRALLVKFSKYSGLSLLVNAANVTRSQCIIIFFNIFLGVIANAAMGIANQVTTAVNSFVLNFSQAFRPQLIKSWAAEDYSYFYKLLFLSSKISYLLLLILSVPLVCNIDFILFLWLGNFPPMTTTFIECILLYCLVDAFQNPLFSAVHATGNIKFHQVMISLIVFLYIPIAYLFLKWGFSGSIVLLLNVGCNLVCAIGRTIYMKKLISLDLAKFFKEVVFPLLVITLLSVPLIYYISNLIDDGWHRLFVSSVFSTITISSLSYVIGLTSLEKNYFKSLPFIKHFRR